MFSKSKKLFSFLIVMLFAISSIVNAATGFEPKSILIMVDSFKLLLVKEIRIDEFEKGLYEKGTPLPEQLLDLSL